MVCILVSKKNKRNGYKILVLGAGGGSVLKL
jgi:hypothetical protein